MLSTTSGQLTIFLHFHTILMSGKKCKVSLAIHKYGFLICASDKINKVHMFHVYCGCKQIELEYRFC